MLRKVFIGLILVVAVVMAVLGITLPREKLSLIILVTNFFDIMIPVLGVGALVNYLWKSCCCCHREE